MPIDSLDDLLAGVRLPANINHRFRYGATVRFGKIRDRLGTRTTGEMYDQALAFWSDDEIGRLTGHEKPTRPLCDIYPGSFAEQLCLWDLHHYLPGDILTKVDRATMAVSIEGREPLLDHRLVEFAFRLPLHLRRGSLGPKHLLRKVLYKYVPRELIDRPKQGFGIPLKQWLAGEMRPLLNRYLEPSRIASQGILDPLLVRRILARFKAGDELMANRVWLLLAFQMWHERWMEA
jgi:asparagine synthase (glutamine-hydrolysing)